MELRDHLDVIWMRRWMIIGTTLGVTALALALSLRQPPTYQGESRVLLTAQNMGTALLGAPQTGQMTQPGYVETQVQIIASPPLLQRVIEKLSLRATVDGLARQVSVSAIGQTNLVKIDVRNQDPVRAAETANALAKEYVAWSRDAGRASIQAAADEVQARLVQARTRITELERPRGTATGDSQTELQTLKSLSATLAGQLQTLQISQQLETGAGVVMATTAADVVRVAPNPLQNAGLAFAFGLVIALGVAFVAERLDTTISSSDEAESFCGAPILGDIPTEKFERGEDRRLTMVQHPQSPAAEAYRMLGSNLNFLQAEQEIKTLLVTSAEPGEGKSTVAANLATALAEGGKRVVLVISDFHRPSTTAFFDVSEDVGLSDVLAGTSDVFHALQRPSDTDSLWVLAAGPAPANPNRLLGSSRMQGLLGALGAEVDWVIIDTPPLLTVADGLAVAPWADGVLIVMHAGVSTQGAAKRGPATLEKVGARIVGVVVWGLDQAKHSYGGYGSYGSYAHSDHAQR